MGYISVLSNMRGHTKKKEEERRRKKQDKDIMPASIN